MRRWNNPGNKWRKWRALESWERRFMLKMIVLLPVTWLGLRVVGFKRMMRSTQRAAVVAPKENASMARVLRQAELIKQAAAIILPGGSCLAQALVLCRYLKKQGVDATVKLGFKAEETPFRAHAWVESLGRPLDRDTHLYREFTIPVR